MKNHSGNLTNPWDVKQKREKMNSRKGWIFFLLYIHQFFSGNWVYQWICNLFVRYESWDDPEIPKFHYGSHYSSAGIVLFYLLRLPPFSTENQKLQGGQFDHADRLFNSVKDTWSSAAGRGNTSDVKELIPEFFYMPEFLENRFDLDLGEKQSGEKVRLLLQFYIYFQIPKIFRIIWSSFFRLEMLCCLLGPKVVLESSSESIEKLSNLITFQRIYITGSTLSLVINNEERSVVIFTPNINYQHFSVS